MVTILAALLDEIMARAASSPEREVCGLLFGTSNHIGAVRHAANVAPVPENSFEIDPRVLIAALRAERAGGVRLAGHYHSHPNGSSAPSSRDLAAAEPGRLWLICGRGEPRLWLAEAECFRPLPLRRT